jgi:hypothetical protein
MRLQTAGRFCFLTFFLCVLTGFSSDSAAVDKLVGFHSARTMSQAMPWIAEEAGLFKKYELDFQLVYISSAPIVTAAQIGRAHVSTT